MTEVATFYRFVTLDDPAALAVVLEERGRKGRLRGTVLVAPEGLNGTLTGSPDALQRWLEALRMDKRFAELPVRFSAATDSNRVFHRLKVRVRDEIVALRRPGIDPARRTGQHVDPQAWDALLDDPGVLLIDARNSYEIEVGTFPGAIDPGTRSFREFPDFVATLDAEWTPRVAMFCTGGVRCEKASAYMLEAGFAEVYQLEGGILNYLDGVAAAGRFRGECFVFDQRVSVTEDLDQGGYVQCFACRRALTERDLRSPLYREGISCGYCHDQLGPAQQASLVERRRQVKLAERRGELHVGADMGDLRSEARQRGETP